ncbi:MAG: polyprenol monophosphomannose synthase [Pleurocapsa minor GSE-CHR-MK-17-07R]|jgi:dolichol-phosphate mannosyltransferase|nr:polyprenol monophosphomannose synthase [Pleurocapsa minor GSE-CHR-MK 17-07R]
MQNVTIVLPTYNEIENLPLMADALLALPVEGLQILVVDDNSPDGTGAAADALSQQHPGRVHVLHRTDKNGLGPAYRAGFRKAIVMGADIIVQMDCDFSHKPEYVPQIVAKLNEGNDMVLGSRYVRGGSVDEAWSWYRKLLSMFANQIYVRAILGIPVNDATGGFRAWKRDTLIGLDLDRVQSNGYIFQVEMAYLTCRLGYKVAEVPIYFPDRKLGQSKMDVRIQREAAIATWKLRARHKAVTPGDRRTETYSS